MCSISGILNGSSDTPKHWELMSEIFRNLIEVGSNRGRDSVGFCQFNDKCASVLRFKTIKNIDFDIDEMHVIINNRAEATTEYIKEKTFEDIQPFTSKNWRVVHNGTISNDKKIVEKYHLKPKTKIDTAVIPLMLEEVFGNEFPVNSVIEFLQEELVGSFALAIVHKLYPDQILLMCNYKPIYIGYYHQLDTWVFATQPEAFSSGIATMQQCSVQKLPPYSSCLLKQGSQPKVKNLLPKKKVNEKRAIVICSGGLDSTVAATIASQNYKEVTLLHFLYKCKAESKEKEAVVKIAEYLRCNVKFIKTDIFKEILSSSLTDVDKEITQGEIGIEYAHEWIYSRNLIMLSIALGYAEKNNFDVIMLGNNLEEENSYSDNCQEFIRKFGELIPNSVNLNKKIEIAEPVGNLMKHEIVKLGLEINAPLHLSWSCYEGKEVRCGTCGPCNLRKKAFAMNDRLDLVPYSDSKII